MPALARLRSLTLPLALLIVLTGLMLVGTTTTAPSAQALDRPRAARHATTIARHQIGDPYRYGADGPNAFDCSGLVKFSYRKAGFRHIPRTSSAQARRAHRIKKRNMHRGDLMFFTDGGGVYHVGIFVGFRHGHRRVLHAPYSGARVRIERVWTHHWFAGTFRKR